MKKILLDYTLRIRIPIIIIVVLISFLATYIASRAERNDVGYSPVQPIAFSHTLHAGTMHIDCQYCHSSVTSSPHANVPAVSVCMNCHTIARKDKPEIIKLKKYYDAGIALPWKRVHRLPDFVYFNHSVHVNSGLDCVNCHGDVASMDGDRQVVEFTMAACLNCHRNAHTVLASVPGVQNGPDNCWTCHR